MTLANKIASFVAKAQTKLRELQTALIVEFDYRGYQSEMSEDLLLKISETHDFIELLLSYDRGQLTEKKTRELIDFFIKWLDLNKVIASNYVNYQMPIQANILLPGGSVASTSALAAEILARIAADVALGNRIDAIVSFDPGEIFPDNFFDNYNANYAVVFDDDPRLHAHANIVELDQVLAGDILNIKALTSHFASIGTPGGQHVSQVDRDRWDAIVAETAERIAEDVALNLRIDNLLPAGFLDNYVADYKVVFNDDARLHTHANISGLNSLNDDDFINVKNLVVHYLSVGDPLGIHVTEEDRNRWDASGSGVETVYDLGSPATLTVGGLPAATVLTGRTWQSILEEILVEYLNPAFSSFSVNIASIVEVGTVISGFKDFAWGTSNSGNVQANSIAIRDVTGAVYLATGLANDGSQSLDIGTIGNTVPMTYAWRAEGINTVLGAFNSGQDTVTSIYPFFYGKVSSGGAAPGVGRPVANQALIDSGSKVVAASSGTVNISFASTSDDYVWFAIPASMASKVSWYINDLNNGNIGGAVGAGGNLFPTAEVVEIDSPTALWADVDYKFYVSNYQSSVLVSMAMRNT